MLQMGRPVNFSSVLSRNSSGLPGAGPSLSPTKKAMSKTLQNLTNKILGTSLGSHHDLIWCLETTQKPTTY